VGPLFESLEAFLSVIHGKSSFTEWRGELDDFICKIIHFGKDREYAGGLLEDRLKIP
jgi:hypothetical protein